MYKCEVVATELYGDYNDDLEFYKGLPEKTHSRYMRLRLIEKYDKDKFPLADLREHGLTNVQGRSKVTPQLLNYLKGNC